MNILLIGSGGREHAIANALARGPRLRQLFIAPGNPGMARRGELVDLDVADHRAVVEFCRQNGVGLVVVGPEQPLIAGIADDLAAQDILVFGPTRAAARLEGSKGFTKDLCRAHHIPTADYGRFDNEAAALVFAREKGAPIVVKADGLAAGKGVVVAQSLDEAERAIRAMFAGSFRAFRLGSGDRGIFTGRGSLVLRALRRREGAELSGPRRITSASAKATPAPTPAAWAPIRRPAR